MTSAWPLACVWPFKVASWLKKKCDDAFDIVAAEKGVTVSEMVFYAVAAVGEKMADGEE